METFNIVAVYVKLVWTEVAQNFCLVFDSMIWKLSAAVRLQANLTIK